jgi:hypothetical protein
VPLNYISALLKKTLLLLLGSIISNSVFSQSLKGIVLSGENNSAIAYVNIGLIGKNIGTVSDESGHFEIKLDKEYDNDSLRFSMIGYESGTFMVRSLREDSVKNIYLKPRLYTMKEVVVVYHRPKKIRLGTPVLSNDLRSGFANNNLGSELGINVFVKRRVKINNINLNVAVCTFDSVTYRLNIYKSVNQSRYQNILNEPIYISFTKNMVDKVISFDLSKYSIIIEGDIIIALELYKDLGEGSLLFHTEFFTGTTYHRKASEAIWTKAAGAIGMYLNCDLIR